MAYDPKRHLEALVELLLSGYLSIACVSIASNFFKPNGWLAKLRSGILLPMLLSVAAMFADRWRAIGANSRVRGYEDDAGAQHNDTGLLQDHSGIEIARQRERSLGRS